MNQSRFSVLCPQSLRGLAILMMKGQTVVLGVLRRSTNQVIQHFTKQFYFSHSAISLLYYHFLYQHG